MTLKTTWGQGDKFFHTDANAVASQINANTAVAAAAVAAAAAAQSTADGKQPSDADLTAIAALDSAANKVLYSTGSGAWALADLTVAARALLDDADAATMRATLATLGLVQAAKNPDLLVTGAITLDGNDLLTSAAVVWPDATVGTLTITSRDANNAVLAYNITYGSPVTKTYTQPTITRNANGAATNVPAIVVS